MENRISVREHTYEICSILLNLLSQSLAKESLVNGQTKQNNDCEACVMVCRFVLCATVKLEIFNALLCLRMLMTAN